MTGHEAAHPDDPSTGSLTVRDQHLQLPEGIDPDATYDVLLNDGHVWSLQPGRDARRRGQALVVPWPKALDRYLSGRATVDLRDHVSGRVLATGEHASAGSPTATSPSWTAPATR